MVYAADIAADFWAIVRALVLSLLISMAFVGVLMQRLLKNHNHPRGAAMNPAMARAPEVSHPSSVVWYRYHPGRLSTGARRLRENRWLFLQPVLASMLLVIGVLLSCGLSYAEYRKSTDILSILLGPATVAMRRIRQLFWPHFYYAGNWRRLRHCVGGGPGLVVQGRAHDADDPGL